MKRIFPINISWEITQDCTRKCNHCYIKQYPVHQKSVSISEQLIILAKLKEAQISSINYIGGEPSLSQNFLKILEKTDSYKIPFSFNTHCVGLNDEFFNFICNLPSLKAVIVSLDDLNKTNNDIIRGEGSWDSVLNLFKKVKNRKNFQIIVNMIINKYSIRNHPIDIIRTMQGYGADRVIFYSLVQTKEIYDFSCTIEDTINFLFKLFRDGDEQAKQSFCVRPLVADYFNYLAGRRLVDLKYFGCISAGTEYRIEPNGKLVPCSVTTLMGDSSSYSGTLLNYNFNTLRKKSSFEKFMNKKNDINLYNAYPCNQCKYFSEMCMPCPYSIPKEKDHQKNCIEGLCGYVLEKFPNCEVDPILRTG